MERVDNQTPQEIVDLFQFPYKFFSNMLGNKRRTVLDAGCGQATNYDLLKKKFKKVILVDKEKFRDDVIQCDLLHIPLEDKSVNVVFCFEVIEHLTEQKELLEELFRIAKDYVVIGSVNKYGPDYFKGVEIYKAKNRKNPYHLQELDCLEFRALNDSVAPDASIVNYWNSQREGDELVPKEGLSINGLVNYAINII